MSEKIRETLINTNSFNIFETYANEKYFSKVLFFAYKNKDSSHTQLADYANGFIDASLLLLINKPSDLLTCLKSVSKRQQLNFLEFLLRHKHMNRNVCIFLGKDMDLINKLPSCGGCGWLEIPTTSYCGYLLNNTKEIYSIYELLPLYEIAPDDLKEYVFSFGFEEDRLDEPSILAFKELFPHKYEMLSNLRRAKTPCT